MPHGLLVIDKPLGITSRAALDRAAHWFPRRTRIGHAGTLDPLATGVLVLCVGHATRLTEFVQSMPKVYESEFTLGSVSATDDAEGPIEAVANVVAPERLTVEQVCGKLTGVIQQIPPAFSAAKVAGRRAYAVSRGGGAVELKPRTVRVDRIEILDYQYPSLRVRIDCGKGTYVRSLARDLGVRLGCGAYVASLRRTRIGPFAAESACRLEFSADDALCRLLPPIHAVAGLPTLTVSASEVADFRHGRRIRSNHRSDVGMLAVVDAHGDLIGVGRAVGDEIQPACVLPAPE